jgi:hypothetical protein
MALSFLVLYGHHLAVKMKCSYPLISSVTFPEDLAFRLHLAGNVKT